MKSVFWISAFLIVFTYAGYPICAYLRARFWPLLIRKAAIFPSISIILAVRNEERNLHSKLSNLASLAYPAELVEIIVVSDCSTDETNRILSGWEATNRCPIILPEQMGKAAALNQGMTHAKGEIVVFTDARQRIASNALTNLVMRSKMGRFSTSIPSLTMMTVCAGRSIALCEKRLRRPMRRRARMSSTSL